MTYEQIFWTFQTAIQHGGGFYSKLGEAGVLADAENKQLLLKTFPKLISHYGPNSTLHVRPANPKPVELPKL